MTLKGTTVESCMEPHMPVRLSCLVFGRQAWQPTIQVLLYGSLKGHAYPERSLDVLHLLHQFT